jgi:hypothetical protein
MRSTGYAMGKQSWGPHRAGDGLVRAALGDGVDVGEQDEVAGAARRDVALQVAFERQTLKPIFHLIGFRLWV